MLVVVLWTLFELTLSVNFLVSLLTWRDTVTSLSELKSLIASNSGTLGTGLLVISWAASNFTFIVFIKLGVWSTGLNNLETLLVLQLVSWLTLDKLTFS